MASFKAKQPRAKGGLCWRCDRRLYGGGRFYVIVTIDGCERPVHGSCATDEEVDANVERIKAEQAPTLTGSLRGHPIYYDGKRWRYSDNDEATADAHASRPCGTCGKHKTPEGHDPCIGTLPDVTNACCGHGVESEAYIQYKDGTEVRGAEAVDRMERR